MQNDYINNLKTKKPWQRTGVKRTPKQRMCLALGILIGLYVVNVAANTLHKFNTHWQIDLLHTRMESLARIDRNDSEIARIRQLIDVVDYASLLEAAPLAIAKRSTVTTYLKRNPHLTLGIAVDGDDYTSDRIIGMLRDLNRRLRLHRLSVGLAESSIKIKIPALATRDDILQGIATAFQNRPDYVIALTAKRCGYTTAKPHRGEPNSNRIYTFGWRGLTVVDSANFNEELTTRLQTELTNFLLRDTSERRWGAADYALRPEDNLTNHQIIGRLGSDYIREMVPADDPRTVYVSIGLDEVSPAEARAAIQDSNALFRSFGIKFIIQHLYPHRLTDQWKWPIEMKKMLGKGTSDIYVLLTSGEWASPTKGLVRGLANATAGAVMIQTGKRDETSQRLAHEFGHLFNLPHTLLTGHIMYPIEGEIGLRWSPGSKILLAKNKQNVQWFSSITSEERLSIATKLAPVMRRSTAASGVSQSEAFASGDVWVNCGAS